MIFKSRLSQGWELLCEGSHFQNWMYVSLLPGELVETQQSGPTPQFQVRSAWDRPDSQVIAPGKCSLILLGGFLFGRR